MSEAWKDPDAHLDPIEVIIYMIIRSYTRYWDE